MSKHLLQLLSGKSLYEETATTVMSELAAGKYSDEQIEKFLRAYIERQVTPAELRGFRTAILAVCKKLTLPDRTIDLCGTGGDGKSTFNISTLSAFLVAAHDTPVAKHGNYGASSNVGSSNLLEGLKIKLPDSPSHVEDQLGEVNLTFLHAPFWHPALKVVGPVRKRLAVRTVFNLLGPIVNPGQPKFQLIGTANSEIQKLYFETLKDLGIQFSLITTEGGFDEVTLTGPAICLTNNSESKLTVDDFSTTPVSEVDLKSGVDLLENVALAEKILRGKGTAAQNKVVCANAACALQFLEPNKTLSQLFKGAGERLKEGEGYRLLEVLRR